MKIEAETLRDCLKRSNHSQATDHQAGHGDVDPGFAGFRKNLIVLTEPTTLGEPGKGALNHPTPRQNHKAFVIIRT